MAAGLPLPRQVFGHGFMTVNGQRMSKSLGTVIDPRSTAGSRRFGADPLRLYLVKEIPFGGDGDFSWERYDERYNVDLANNLGNLVSRVSAMVGRYRQGPCVARRRSAEAWRGRRRSRAGPIGRRWTRCALHEGAAAAFRVDRRDQRVHRRDGAVDAGEEPGERRSARAGALRRRGGHSARGRAAAADHAGVERRDPAARRRARRHLRSGPRWPLARRRRARSPSDGPLWPRKETGDRAADDGASYRAVEPQTGPKTGQQRCHRGRSDAGPSLQPPPLAPATAAPEAEQISIDDFMKVELRVAKVLAAERVPEVEQAAEAAGRHWRRRSAPSSPASPRSYEPRRSSAGTVAIVFNLKPAKLMGIESNGMVLAASPEGGKPTLVTLRGAAGARHAGPVGADLDASADHRPSACRSSPPSRRFPPVRAAEETWSLRAWPMNTIAERYVKLVLAVGQHDPAYVDAFYGPAEWKAAAEAGKRPLCGDRRRRCAADRCASGVGWVRRVGRGRAER